ncbi:MAG: hydroxymethylbilane synthase [Clostridium sp.]|nr:hydroxymethylbilane synthase [Clostridium sp.]
MTIKLATRKSVLARTQTKYIMNLLKEYDVDCEEVLTDTLGDKRLDVTLDKIGGKGVFIKELEKLMVLGEAHGGVHSMKDVPYELPDGFEVAAMPVREDVRDAFISSNGTSFKALKVGARVGTSSKRRAEQLKILRPDIEIVPIRGNVQTRLEKMKTESLDGIVLAAAGLKRLELEHLITNYFEVEEIVPAIAQGALGVEIYKDCEYKKEIKALDNLEVRICVEAERSFMTELQGDCHSTIGAYAHISGDKINIIGIYDVNGKLVKSEIEGNKEDNIELGKTLARNILGER